MTSVRSRMANNMAMCSIRHGSSSLRSSPRQTSKISLRAPMWCCAFSLQNLFRATSDMDADVIAKRMHEKTWK